MEGEKIKEKGAFFSRRNLEKEDLQVRFNFPLQMIAEAGQVNMWTGRSRKGIWNAG